MSQVNLFDCKRAGMCQRMRRATTFLVCLSCAFVSSIRAVAQEETEEADGLPTYGEMLQQIPTMQQLLTDEALDWIVLKSSNAEADKEVLVVQRVAPRPDTIRKMNAELARLGTTAGRPKRLSGESREDYQERLVQLRDEATYLTVSLPDDPADTDPDAAAEYKLHVARNIERIIYHEDLLLKRAGILMDEGRLDKAFELLLILERNEAGWPGYAEMRNRLLFEEGQLRMGEGQLEEALAFFEELHMLAPQHQGLRTAMGSAVDALIKHAEELGDLRRARYYLLRLRGRDAGHPVSLRWTEDFSRRTAELIRKAEAERQSGRHAEAFALATEAAGVWPPHPQLRASYNPIADRYQVLSVGVTRLASEPSAFFLPTDADRRIQSLQETDLFQLRRFDRAAFYESRVFEEWTPTDLGRQIVFTLRRRRANWESNPVLTSEQVVRSIGSRIKPGSRYYDERLSTFVRSIDVRSPQQFVLNFSTVPVRPQALLRFPVQELAGAPAATGDSDGSRVLSQRFVVQQQDDSQVSLRRSIPQVDRQSTYRVAEIVEKKYTSSENLIQALLRGDVSVIPRPPLWYIDELEKDDRFYIEKYGVATTHVLQFNPESQPLKNAEFRRALARIIDRKQILADTVLRDARAQRGRVVSAPFPRGSYAYDIRYDDKLNQNGAGSRDLPLAFFLIKFTEKRLGGQLPALKMVCEPGEVVLAAAEKLVAQWAQLGIKVTIVDDAQATPSDWDIVYRTVRMTEPVTELWPFLTMKPDARVEDLEHLPDWLRQQLIELEQSVDFNTSVDMLRGLHFRLNELVHVVPLWEVDDVIVVRKNIQGFPRRLIHPYQNVEQWKVTPWYSTNLL